MNHGEIMVVMIVAIMAVAGIIKASVRGPRHPVAWSGDDTKAENQRLRDEVQELKERLKVIERITVEKENSLSREIESLRDR